MAAEDTNSQHHAPPQPQINRSANVNRDGLNTCEMPHDPHNPDYGKWFNSSLKHGSGDQVKVWPGNEVVGLIDGPDTFKSMVEAIKTANGDKDFIYLAGWSLSDGIDLGNGASIHNLFTEAISRNVEIRVLLSGHGVRSHWYLPSSAIPHYNPNQEAVENLNNLRGNCWAILDQRVINFSGAHHQKILVVKGSNGLFAFCGGVDIYEDRIASPGPPPRNDENSTIAGTQGAPLHDVHCRIQGPAATDLLRIFVERWNNNVEHLSARPNGKAALSARLRGEPLLGAAASHKGEVYVQIGRTYGNSRRHPDYVPGGFRFAPDGEQTARQITLHAIGQAETLIYMEDQYLVNMEASDALKRQLDCKPHLYVVILIPATNITDMSGARQHRRAFVDNLGKYYDPSSPKSRVAVCQLGPRPGTPHTYVHAKMYLIDDKLAIIGSANCNRRSWTNDSEVVAAIYEPSTDNKLSAHFAHHLRMRLWAEHLGMKQADLYDIGSTAHWFHLKQGQKVQPFNRDENDAASTFDHTAASWDSVDPNGS